MKKIKLLSSISAFILMCVFVILVIAVANPSILFTLPTFPNATVTGNTSIEINVSITNAENLTQIIYNWNGTNYTMYNNSLVLYLNFDNVSTLGESDTRIVDLAGNDDNATVSGAVWSESSGKYGGAFELDGVKGSTPISVESSTRVNVTDYTISMWFMRKGAGSEGGFGGCFGGLEALTAKGGGGGDGGGIDAPWNFGYDGGTDHLVLCMEDGSGTDATLEGTTAISEDVWYHALFTMDASTMAIYLNGVLENSGATSGAPATNNLKIGIGTLYEEAANNIDSAFNGTIDNFMIWNRTLSVSEINQNYMSNLYKYDTDKWIFYINQSKDATTELVSGTYAYYVSSINLPGDINTTEVRIITIEGPDNPPTVTLTSPSNGGLAGVPAVFDCSATDSEGLVNITLYGNWTGAWIANETKSITGTSDSETFTLNLDNSKHIWNCLAFDNANQSSFASSNYTVTTGGTTPLINFTSPTRGNNTITADRYIDLNVSIVTSDLGVFKWGWNNTNYILYNDSLVVGFNFDNLSELGECTAEGCIVKDFSKYDNDGNLIILTAEDHLPNWTSMGRYGGAMDFVSSNHASDGASINIPHADNLNPYGNDFTMMFWFKCSSICFDTDISRKGSTATHFDGGWYKMEIGGYGAANFLSLQFNTAGADDATLQSGTDVCTDRKWHFAVGQRVGNTAELYIDGVQKTDFVNQTDATLSGTINNTANLSIGSKDVPDDDFFNGTIDEYRLYMNRSFSASEIAIMYMSNLRQYDTDKWSFYINQSKNASTGLDNGAYTYQSFASDSFNNINQTEERTITITSPDVTLPTITINSPTNIIYRNTTINFNITATDNVAISECWYSLNLSGINISMSNDAGSFWNATNSSMRQGAHIVDYFCNDTVNNINTASVAFSITNTTIKFDPFYDGVSLGNLDDGASWQEISGIAITQNESNTGYIWAQSDGSVDLLLAINLTDASNSGEWTLEGINGVDYEDLSSATINGIPYIFLADFGDNGDARATIIIYRIREPTINNSDAVIKSADIETITCEYPGGGDAPSHKDAETFLVDPLTGDMYVITKRETVPGVYSLAYSASYTGTQTLVYEGDMWDIPTVSSVSATGNAVGGDISSTGLEILIKNYNVAFLFSRSSGSTSVFDTLSSEPINLSSYAGGGNTGYAKSHPSQEPQGEAITFDRDSNRYFTASEYVAAEGSSATTYPLFGYNRTSRTVKTIVFQQGVSPDATYIGTNDTYVHDDVPDTSFESAVTFIVDVNVGDDRVGFLKFNISQIPANSTIIGAKVDLNIDTEGQGWTFHRILNSDWPEASTFNNIPNGPPVIDDVFASSIEDNRNGINLNGYTGTVRNNVLVNTLQAWMDGTQENYGWMLLATHATDGQQFDSKESATAADRPKLTVRYMEPLADNAPTVTLVSPSDAGTSTTSSIFECSATDDNALVNMTLYGNWTGAWSSEETKPLTSTSDSETFSVTVTAGTYVWNCLAFDDERQSSFASNNYTVTITPTGEEVTAGGRALGEGSGAVGDSVYEDSVDQGDTKNISIIDRLFSNIKDPNNGICDDGENFLFDKDCNISNDDILSGRVLKQMWLLRLVMLSTIFLLLKKSRKVPFLMIMFIILLIYNRVFG